MINWLKKILFNKAEMTKDQLHIAQLQDLCKRTLMTLESEKFFDITADGEFWYSSLHRELSKSADGEELKTFGIIMAKLTSR